MYPWLQKDLERDFYSKSRKGLEKNDEIKDKLLGTFDIEESKLHEYG